MDYNRVQSYIKSHVLPKLDSLQTGMDGIPNLLTPSFDSIKNVLSTITTKVDNVRGGVDLNHTALTDLQQRLTAVEGSVGKIEQDVGGLGVPSNLKAATATSSGTILDIKGKGKLYACGISAYDHMNPPTLDITINGTVKKVSKYISGHGPLGAYVSVPALLDMSADRNGSSNPNATYFKTVCGRFIGTKLDGFGIRFVEEDSIPNDFNGNVYITRQPLTFSSLKAYANIKAESNTLALIAYTLDE